MSANRLQKLLLSEYSDFQDMVLVESPFAQTTREGRGIRQIHLGITPSKLILATDKLVSATEIITAYIPGIDPELETFELIAVYPVECMFWNLWCERIRNLSSEDIASSHSETSAATSTSNSTLYLVSKKKVVTEKGVEQLWCNFGAAGDASSHAQKWLDKNIYLGKNFVEHSMYYVPEVRPPSLSQFVSTKRRIIPRGKLSLSSAVAASFSKELNQDVFHVNRFAEGIKEGCSTSLFLPAENFIVAPNNFSNTTTESTGVFSKLSECSNAEFDDFAEICVKLWENFKETEPNLRRRHKRRYALTPQPYFLYGLGPWNITPGARFSTQIKRTASMVSIRRQPAEPELRLPVSRRQLTASISYENLYMNKKLGSSCNNIKLPPKTPVIFFWTPDYWYRPRSAKDAYKELQNHLSRIRYQVEKSNEQKHCKKKKIFRKKKQCKKASAHSLFEEREEVNCKPQKGPNRLFAIFGSRQGDFTCKGPREARPETSLQYLKRILRMTATLSAWDFDSTTLAQQLILIDKELFLKIPPVELGVLVWQQSSKNAPNIGALVAFAHRISCLVASEVLHDDSEKIRARLIVRFINAADKCNKMASFHSCRSLLCGLQSPSVYRLYKTWSHVRKMHASKYHVFENLCKIYRDPRLPIYQRAFHEASHSVAYVPFIGDLIARLLDKVPDNISTLTPVPPLLQEASDSFEPTQSVEPKSNKTTENVNVIRKILSSLKVWPTTEVSEITRSPPLVAKRKVRMRSKPVPKDLIDLYGPLNVYQDNRLRRLSEVVDLLERCQRAAAHYRIATNDLAREFLLKARYREDRDNFLNSFNREPAKYVTSNIRCVCDE